SRLLKRLDPCARLTFVGNDDEEHFPQGVDKALVDRTIVVVDPNGRVYSEEHAVFEIGRAIPFGILAGFWLRIPGLSSLGRAAYRALAKTRIAVSSSFGLGACGVARPASGDEKTAAATEEETFRAWRGGAATFMREGAAALIVVILGIQ